MNHIVVMGFMGSGKTRVGNRLAQDFALPFVDIDVVIEKRMKLSAREMFDRFGEPFYRAMETMIVKELVKDKERKVISIGSGLPMQEQNEKYLKQLGTIVYLKGSLETLKKRIRNAEKHPLLGENDQEEKMKRLLKQRDPIYEKFADIVVVTGEIPFEQLVNEIEKKLS